MPDVRSFFAEVVLALKPKALCLVDEPEARVSTEGFEETLGAVNRTA